MFVVELFVGDMGPVTSFVMWEPSLICAVLQIGSGYSLAASDNEGPTSDEMSLDLYLNELEAVVAAAKFKNFHLLGHGWGGMLALTAVEQGRLEGVASLTLLSTPPSYKSLVTDRLKNVRHGPAKPQRTLAGPCRLKPLVRSMSQRHG
jgi:pimeloyl-ACP methyl ester carboxylesterase